MKLARKVATAAAMMMATAGLSVAAAPEAQAYGTQRSSVYSVAPIYTRPCLNFTPGHCPLVKVYPGRSYPSTARYHRVARGYKACKTAIRVRRCVYSSYVPIWTSTINNTWKVSRA